MLCFDPALPMAITYDGTQITADRTLESRVLGLLNKGHVVSVRGYSTIGLCALCMRSQHSVASTESSAMRRWLLRMRSALGVPALCSLPLSRSRHWVGLPSHARLWQKMAGFLSGSRGVHGPRPCPCFDRALRLAERIGLDFRRSAKPRLGDPGCPALTRTHARMLAHTHARFHAPAHTHPRTRARSHTTIFLCALRITLFKAARGYAWGCVAGVGNSHRS